MREMNTNFLKLLLVVVWLVFFTGTAVAVDEEVTRRTFKGLPGVSVIVEDFQPNIKNHVDKAGFSKDNIKTNIETRLKNAGIQVMQQDEMLKTRSKPVLYVNINTHEYERYFFAYDIKLELRQLVAMETDPQIKSLVATWDINLTGAVNLGNLNVLNKNLNILLDRFIKGYREVNGLQP